MRAIKEEKESVEVSADETWDYLLSELLQQKEMYKQNKSKNWSKQNNNVKDY